MNESNNTCGKIIALIGMFVFFALSLFSLSATAQSLPGCIDQAADPDGDGFGWQFNQSTGDWGSCRITADSAAPPSFISDVTGDAVVLQRAYWDPNVDIANRTMRCDYYEFDPAQQQYVVTNPAIPIDTLSSHKVSQVFMHEPLGPSRPYIGSVFGSQYPLADEADFYIPLWGVENGIYQGYAPLTLSPYVEVVSINGGTDNAVRIWQNLNDSVEFRSVAYHQCYDLSGGALVPTGTLDGGTTNPIAEPTEFTLTFPTEADDSDSYTNLATGQPVVLVDAVWNYHTDLALRRVACNSYGWDGSVYRYNLFVNWNYIFHPSDGNTVIATQIYTDVFVSISTKEVPVIDGSIEFLENLGRVELFDNGVRIWESDLSYRECIGIELRGVGPDHRSIWTFPNAYQSNFFANSGWPADAPIALRPTGSLAVADNCDYSSADLYAGWGWDPVAGESCPPLTSSPVVEPLDSDCDYNNAETNGGWGWNPVAAESCPPLSSQTVDTDCDYSNADLNGGWGWNPVAAESCPPITDESSVVTPVVDNCDYSAAAVNGGWGWDNVAMESCSPVE